MQSYEFYSIPLNIFLIFVKNTPYYFLIKAKTAFDTEIRVKTFTLFQ